ncbi:hypothetical protein [Pseudoxanthomonas putridarboris]|uniref:Uncharacterized protein n=1 Tax=Pseudoxanthomonas putridarboris TaxID=752605 RepID=A0ABU9IZV8_9GAMM
MQAGKPIAARLTSTTRPDKAAKSLSLFLLFSVISTFFWWLFHERYLKHADCIEALANSSCITPEGDNLTSGGILWALVAILFGLLAAIFLCVSVCRLLRRRSVAIRQSIHADTPRRSV